MTDFEPKQFGKYFLTDKLAVGGMAEIYKAKTYGVDGFEKVLCIKRILPHAAADKDFVTMLIDEAKLSVLLSHANIVQVYDLGKVGDDYFIAMEFIHGVNLRDIMYSCREAQRSIPPEISCFITSEICKGLDYAHRKTDADNKPLNIVHRDVSPQNIQVSYEGEVKIVDFGIAKAAMNISHTMAGILKGKIAYMSPEQAMGKAIDTRTDIFATGILLYEMLTGQKLFTGESQFEVLKKIRTSDIKADTLPDTIPEKLREIMAKALASNVEDRYQTAGDLQIDLTRYLYSSYADFSPRKIAVLVQDLFKEEIAQEQEAKAREAAHEAQTTSMNVQEGARQVELVQGQESPEGTAALDTAAAEPTAKTPTPAAAAIPAPPTTPPPGKKKRRWPWAITALIILGAGIGAATQFIPQLRFWEKAAAPTSDVTTATINSDPQGANVSVNGKRTGLKTPAVIPSLDVGKSYRIRLEKDQFIPVDQMLTISSALPLTVTIPMAKEAGGLNISSAPPGAKIYLNGEDTNKVTPATINKIPLGVDQRVTLMKEGFEDVEQVVKLTSKRPQNLAFALNEILPNTGSVILSSEPAGAKIEIDGKDVERVTPTKIVNLELGKEHKLKLTMKDLNPFEKTFTLKDKMPLEIKGELKPPAPETASIYVTSTPEKGRISLDRKATGKHTPATLTDLALDKSYRVSVSLDGYQGFSRTVKISEAKRYSVTASLAPKAKPEAPTTPTPPTPTPPKPTPQPTGAAKLRITSTPSGADAYIDGARKGRTPLTITVQPGRVRVTLKRSGYEDFSTRITARAGKTLNVGGALRPRAARPEPTPTPTQPTGAYAQVSLSSSPPRATVTFDGQVIPAKTPVTVRRVSTGRRHSVTISMPGYKSWSRSFTLTGNQSFHANLKPQ